MAGFSFLVKFLVLGEGVEGAGKGFRFSSGDGADGTARAKSERRQRTEETTRGRELAGCRNFGRHRERLPAAHRRARVVLEPCLAEFAFLVKLLAWERL